MQSENSFRPAERKRAKLKIIITGPSGSGKTYSSLLLAKGLATSWDKIALIDTENSSGDLYSHLGDYLVSDLKAPYSPQNYVKKIKEARLINGLEVLIIDSISHEWDGPGGCLEIHSKLSGNSFANWAKVNPLHDAFVKEILDCPFHVILTARTKTDYSMDKDSSNRTKIEKVGLKMVQREGLDYEVTTAFRLQHNNYVEIDKDRTGLFSDNPLFKITEETGEKIKRWNISGQEVVKSEGQIKKELLEDFKALVYPIKNKALFMEENNFPEMEDLPNMDIDALKDLLTAIREVRND